MLPGSSSKQFHCRVAPLDHIPRAHLQVGVALERKQIEPRKDRVVGIERRVLLRDQTPVAHLARRKTNIDGCLSEAGASNLQSLVETAFVKVKAIKRDQDRGVVRSNLSRPAQMPLGNGIVCVCLAGHAQVVLSLRRQPRTQHRTL